MEASRSVRGNPVKVGFENLVKQYLGSFQNRYKKYDGTQKKKEKGEGKVGAKGVKKSGENVKK